MPWRTAHASAAGTRHAADGIPCQDFHLVDETSDYLIVAVADGAGSARLSGLGAQVACTWAVQSLKAVCTPGMSQSAAEAAVRSAFEVARSEVELAALREAAAVRDLASTLLVVLVGGRASAFGQVGDGAIIFDAGEGLTLSHWPEQEAINLTDFLTSSPLAETLVVRSELGRITRLAVMTDGLTQLLLDFRARSPHIPAIERLFGACRTSPDPAALNDDLRRFLDSPAVNERSDDDKTLVLAVREAAL